MKRPKALRAPNGYWWLQYGPAAGPRKWFRYDTYQQAHEAAKRTTAQFAAARVAIITEVSYRAV